MADSADGIVLASVDFIDDDEGSREGDCGGSLPQTRQG